MRQVILIAPEKYAPELESAIEQYDGKNTVELNCGAYLTYLPNRILNNLLYEIRHIEELKVSLINSPATGPLSSTK